MQRRWVYTARVQALRQWWGLLALLWAVPTAAQTTVDESLDPKAELSEMYEPSSVDDALLSEPLEATGGVFDRMARYNFSFVRYVRRGYDWSAWRRQYNGIDLDDLLTGYPLWNVASVLQNPLLESTVQNGLAPGASAGGAWGGVWSAQSDLLSRQSDYRAGWALTDRRYRQQLRVGMLSGPLTGGWALAVSATRRWGRDQHIRGVYADDWSLLMAVTKRLDRSGHHTLTLLGTVAPTEHGLRSASWAEAFETTGDALYNPSWGYQQGRIRSSRVRKERMPMGVVTWNYTPSDRLHMQSSYAVVWGESSRSSLAWYDAENPTPDYYRYLPSYYGDPQLFAAVGEAWRAHNPAVTQIDWAAMYRVNRDRQDTAAGYILSSDVRHYMNHQLSYRFDYRASSWVGWSGGVRGRVDRSELFARLDDLLGGGWIEDVDPYLIDDRYYGDRAQNNLLDVGRRVKMDERFGYNYVLNDRHIEGWAQVDLRRRENERLGGYVGVQGAYTSFSRCGAYEKELFPGALSLGRSRGIRFTDYALRAGMSYRFSPRHYLSVDGLMSENAPTAEAIFLAPEYRNATVDNPHNESRLGGSFSYRFRGDRVSLELCGYATLIRGKSDVQHYYDDLASVYSDMVVDDQELVYTGAELGVEWLLSNRFTLHVAASMAHNYYRRDPMVTVYSDKDGSQVVAPTPSYMRGYRLGGTPQSVASAELSYRGRYMWMGSVGVNYVGDHYVTPSCLLRMPRIYELASSPEARVALTAQERLPDAFTINLWVMKSFRMGAHLLSVSGSVNNLTDRRKIVYSGYETTRVRRSVSGDVVQVAPLGNKYLYAYPRTYYLTVNFRF